MITITASPRLYWLRHRSGHPPLVEVITEEGRYELGLYPYGLSHDTAKFIWGEEGPGTKLLAMAILWDMFRSREIVEKFFRKFSDEVIEDVRSSVANVISAGMVLEWLQTEQVGRMSVASYSNCGGCGQ